MTRKVLRHAVEVQKFPHARLFEIESGLAKFANVGVFGIAPFEGMRQAAEAFERSDFEPQRLADIARAEGDGDLRLTVWQNLLISGVPAEKLAAAQARIEALESETRQLAESLAAPI